MGHPLLFQMQENAKSNWKILKCKNSVGLKNDPTFLVPHLRQYISRFLRLISVNNLINNVAKLKENRAVNQKVGLCQLLQDFFLLAKLFE